VLDKFKLYLGTSFIEERIRKLVRWDIQRRIRSGEIPKNAVDIVTASGGVIEETLLGSGSYNLEGVQFDLNQARSMTETNIDIMRNHFSSLFDYSLKLLRKQETAWPVPERPIEDILNGIIRRGEDLTNRPNGQTLGKLCVLLLSTGMSWPKGVDWNTCDAAILGSFYADEDNSRAIRLRNLKHKLKSQKLMDRMCTFHNFMRESRLAESL